MLENEKLQLGFDKRRGAERNAERDNSAQSQRQCGVATSSFREDASLRKRRRPCLVSDSNLGSIEAEAGVLMQVGRKATMEVRDPMQRTQDVDVIEVANSSVIRAELMAEGKHDRVDGKAKQTWHHRGTPLTTLRLQNDVGDRCLPPDRPGRRAVPHACKREHGVGTRDSLHAA